MAASVRPRRSVLYMPGSNARALEKGRTLPADALILDLEDAVAPDLKEAARRQVLDALAEGGYGGREILVRVNGLATQWGRGDIAAMAGSGANTIFAPGADELAWSARIIAAHAEAEAAGKGVVVVEGRLVEGLHVENAKRLVELAGMIAELEQAAAGR